MRQPLVRGAVLRQAQHDAMVGAAANRPAPTNLSARAGVWCTLQVNCLTSVSLSLSKAGGRGRLLAMASWVYLLRCADGSYYTGVTSNIEQRLDQHYHGKIGYTAKRKPFEYVWSDEFANIDDAIAFRKAGEGLVARQERSAHSRRLG
ncbi:MAG: GIY-YIG nuclease family protein [Hyphomonadaceae bacterium]|nr:GIY-YIG nuclease family protein [Hyphomonadaceae bacterium]